MKYLKYSEYISKYSGIEKSILLRNFRNIYTLEGLARFLEEQTSTLNYYLYTNHNKYKIFTIPKKTGGVRTISAPTRGLKRILKKLNFVLNLLYDQHPKASAHGFVHNKSIITNAKQHTKKKYVMNIDLKDFFPSVHFGRVKGLFQSSQFDFSEGISHILANLVTNEGVLPQGSPTSPILTNLIVRRMDAEMEMLAKKNKCVYTRYADDITFSFWKSDVPEEIALVKKKSDDTIAKFVKLNNEFKNILKFNQYIYKLKRIKNSLDKSYAYIIPKNKLTNDEYAEIKKAAFEHNLKIEEKENSYIFLPNLAEYQIYPGDKLQEIIKKNGFEINHKKVRIQPNYFRQEVTGIVVNKKTNVTRYYIKTLRAMLHNWETKGLEEAQNKFNSITKTKKDIKKVIVGRLAYLKQVRGAEDTIYKNLFNKYQNIVNPPIKEIGKNEFERLREELGLENILNDINSLKKIVNFGLEPESFEFIKQEHKGLLENLQDNNLKMKICKKEDNFPLYCGFAYKQVECINNFVINNNLINKDELIQQLTNKNEYGNIIYKPESNYIHLVTESCRDELLKVGFFNKFILEKNYSLWHNQENYFENGYQVLNDYLKKNRHIGFHGHYEDVPTRITDEIAKAIEYQKKIYPNEEDAYKIKIKEKNLNLRVRFAEEANYAEIERILYLYIKTIYTTLVK